MEIQYIFMLVLGYVTLCYGQGVSVELPSQCAAVLCAETFCPQPVTPRGECCPICFEDCRLVRCGMAPDAVCVTPPGRCCPVCQPREKPGTCPQLLNPFGHCAEICTSDQDCTGIQKCCSVGCGHECMNPINTPRSCIVNGKVVESGATFKIDCNGCSCSDGQIICTQIACDKPGTCPVVSGPGICVELCQSDDSCQGQEKCCSNGCGHVCMNAVTKPRTCNINGEVVDSGATVKVDCNTCTCHDGNAVCTEKACIEKPGTCPQLRNPFGHCAELCSSDQDCEGQQKCCSVGCGHGCMNPIPIEPVCSNVRCPPLPSTCGNIIRPAGQCCPICPGNHGYGRRRRYRD